MQFRECSPAGHLIAGLETGIIGALYMLVWLALASLYYRRSIWTTANLLATTFYGETSIRFGFGRGTLSGIALHLAVYAILGALFGLAAREYGDRLRLALIGILSAVAWYWLAYAVLWKAVNPIVPMYIHDRPMFWAHVLYGAMLSRYPVLLGQLRGIEVPPAGGSQ